VGADAERINAHYARQGLGDSILDGLRAAGKDPAQLTPDDLAPVDQFHTRGKRATLELAHLAGLHAGQQVLDVGGGLGGPARVLAAALQCRVTVLDLTAEYCRAGEMLTARTGLQDRVSFHHGSALSMPFAAASFDVVWTEHSTMNVADKERLYAETARVLRPGGRLALHEIMAGPVQPLHFPVPWAPDTAISFLRAPAEIRALLAAAGFSELTWRDMSEPSLAWFQRPPRPGAAAGPAAPPPLGVHLLLGPSFGTAVGNLVRNLAEQRAVIVQAVLERP
jgi:sarcosine/dimethylglycine N-methyltransferase